jgi:hypothetical protein
VLGIPKLATTNYTKRVQFVNRGSIREALELVVLLVVLKATPRMLEDVGDKTRLVLHHAGLPEGKIREQTAAGWNQSFDKLARSLEHV